jgi:hypothetical protein
MHLCRSCCFPSRGIRNSLQSGLDHVDPFHASYITDLIWDPVVAGVGIWIFSTISSFHSFTDKRPFIYWQCPCVLYTINSWSRSWRPRACRHFVSSFTLCRHSPGAAFGRRQRCWAAGCPSRAPGPKSATWVEGGRLLWRKSRYNLKKLLMTRKAQKS